MTESSAERPAAQSCGALTGAALASFMLVVAATGCSGEQGPPRYHVSGKVAFKGKPVGFGMIYFQPDGSAGNTGPQGFAKIRDGAFDTRLEGKGSVGGAMIVRITGFDSEPPAKEQSETAPGPKPLFSEYQTNVDLPKEDSTKDFDVPESAEKGPVAPLRAPVGP